MRNTSLVHVLEQRAGASPAAVGFSFRTEGALFYPPDPPAELALTYAELRDRAAGIATALRATAGPGTAALLLYPAGLDFVAALFGCLYAGWIPVPMCPPFRDRDASAATLTEIVRQSGATVVLSAPAIWEFAGAAFPADLAVVMTPELPGSDAAPPARPGPGDPAFIQFTSGSTSDPKGVVVTHANLLDHAAAVTARLGVERTGPFVTWMPHFHDGGLIQGVVQPLCAGVRSLLLAPESFLARPIRWLRAISDARAVLSGGPNFGYELCLRRTTPADRAGLDLTCWTVAPNAGEPIRSETLDRFTDVFSEYGFAPRSHAPAYGLAEATLLATFHATPEQPRVLALDVEALRDGVARTVVPAGGAAGQVAHVVGCGRPLAGVGVAVVEPATGRRCPDRVVGEIWISGPTVAAGYWRNAASTAETFGARIDGEPASYLRTGDLGFLDDGELFPTGRIKDVIIIRGRNIYPQDVEKLAERSHPALRSGCSAAFAFADGSGERLGLLMEVEAAGTELAAVVSAVRRSVAGFVGVQPGSVTLIGRGRIPKTSSGKIRRAASRSLVLAGAARALASWTDGETPAAPGAAGGPGGAGARKTPWPA
jgi:acyl-CoA synthetase (AMP-forming)/AMP-acid ligase II